MGTEPSDPRSWPTPAPGSPFHVPPPPSSRLKRMRAYFVLTAVPIVAVVAVPLVKHRWVDAALVAAVLSPFVLLRVWRVRLITRELRRRSSSVEDRPDQGGPGS